MKTERKYELHKTASEIVKIDDHVISMIIGFIKPRYFGYQVFVHQKHEDAAKFDNLDNAVIYAGECRETVKSIVITAQVPEESFYLEIRNPDKKRGNTVIFKSVCNCKKTLREMRIFFISVCLAMRVGFKNARGPIYVERFPVFIIFYLSVMTASKIDIYTSNSGIYLLAVTAIFTLIPLCVNQFVMKPLLYNYNKIQLWTDHYSESEYKQENNTRNFKVILIVVLNFALMTGVYFLAI